MPIFSADNLEKQMTFVSVHLSKKTTLHVVNTATMTLIDMISNVGGTLGLFSGFSILSVVEVVYWIGRSCGKKKARGRKRRA